MFIKSAELNNRIFGLDLFRSLAIVLVLIAHTVTFLTGKVDHPLTICGFYGVELFFVLSGFLIGTILLKVHNKEESTSLGRVKAFWIRRWFRTLPNYYLMLAVYSLIYFVSKHVFLFADPKHLLYLVFLQNTFFAQPDFFNISWSLSIEEWFYITFPLILLFIQNLSKEKKISFLSTIMVFIIGSLLARILMANSNPKDWDGWFRKLMPLRLDGIAFGVLGAYVKYYYPNIWGKFSKKAFLVGIALIMAVFIILYNELLFNHDLLHVSFFLKTFLFSINSFSILLLLPLVSKIQTRNVPFTSIVTVTSLISYSIYLTHPLIIGILLKLHLQNFIGVIAVWVVTFFVSYFQYSLFETKITRLREKISGGSNSINVSS